MCLHLHFQSHQQHPEPVEQQMLAVKTYVYANAAVQWTLK